MAGYSRRLPRLKPGLHAVSLTRHGGAGFIPRSFNMKQTADVVIIGGGCMGASVALSCAARRDRRRADRARAAARHGLHRPKRRRLPPPILATPPTSSCRRNRSRSSPILRRSRLPDRFLAGRLPVSPRRPTASTRFAERRTAARARHQASTGCRHATPPAVPGPRRRRRARRATYCGDDGIADPNGVTHGFAKAAQARGVEVRRGEEVTACDVAERPDHRRRDDAGVISAYNVVNAAGRGRKHRPMAGVDVPVEPERRHIFIAQPPGGGSWDAADSGQDAVVAPDGDRLRIDLLLPPRGRRAALRHGRSRRAPGSTPPSSGTSCRR